MCFRELGTRFAQIQYINTLNFKNFIGMLQNLNA